MFDSDSPFPQDYETCALPTELTKPSPTLLIVARPSRFFQEAGAIPRLFIAAISIFYCRDIQFFIAAIFDFLSPQYSIFYHRNIRFFIAAIFDFYRRDIRFLSPRYSIFYRRDIQFFIAAIFDFLSPRYRFFHRRDTDNSLPRYRFFSRRRRAQISSIAPPPGVNF